MNGEFLIPIFFFGGTAWVLVVYFNNRHKEHMMMIEKGVNPTDFKGTPVRDWFRINPLSSLKWGLLSAFVGIGLMVGMYLHRNFDVENSVYLACMLIAGGIALVIFYFIASKKNKADSL